TPKEEMHE
uniref:Uncharacterized protein n=1 Tax=Sus scrofa TaxID=9823 RepID=A0A4X1VRB4_PIG